jgi:predicted metal-dependent peptidase
MSKIINESHDGWDRNSSGKKWEDMDTITCPDGQVIDMQKLLDDQQRAKAALVHLQPFFGAFINRLRPVYTFRVETQAVDGVNLFINPQFTYNLDLTGKVFVLAHEIMHCVLSHLRRAKTHGHDMRRANVAGDYEINVSLTDTFGLFKPQTVKNLRGLYDSKYKDWGYEKIYDSNPPDPSGDDMNNKDQSKQAQQNQPSGDSGSGGGGSNNQQYSEDYKKGWNQAMEDYKKGKLKI